MGKESLIRPSTSNCKLADFQIYSNNPSISAVVLNESEIPFSPVIIFIGRAGVAAGIYYIDYWGEVNTLVAASGITVARSGNMVEFTNTNANALRGCALMLN